MAFLCIFFRFFGQKRRIWKFYPAEVTVSSWSTTLQKKVFSNFVPFLRYSAQTGCRSKTVVFFRCTFSTPTFGHHLHQGKHLGAPFARANLHIHPLTQPPLRFCLRFSTYQPGNYLLQNRFKLCLLHA